MASARIATLALIPSAVAFNVAIGTIVRTVKLPIYLDCIGGIVTTLMAGLWPGVLVAVLSQTAAMAFDPTIIRYVGTAVAMSVYAHYLGKIGGFKTLPRIILTGIGMGIVSATVSAPITALNGGITTAGSSAVTTVFILAGHSLLQSVALSGLTCDPVDKIAECLIAVWLIRAVPLDLLTRFHGGTLRKNFKFMSDEAPRTEI
jgi:energy-coupling factor transport system substrate-specific component